MSTDDVPAPIHGGTRDDPSPVLMTDAKKVAFIEAFSRVANIREAAALCGVSRHTHYYWLHHDPEYAENFLQAKEDVKDRIIEAMRTRGIDGVWEPIYQGGAKVGEVRKYSDRCLELLARANMPEIFRENIAHEIGGKGGGPVQVEVLAAAREILDSPRALAAAKELSMAVREKAQSDAGPVDEHTDT